MNVRKTTLAIVATAVCLLCASSASAQNLIVNGDFATGDLTGWAFSTNNSTIYEAAITYDGGGGNPPGSALLARNNSEVAVNESFRYQIIPVVHGSQYQLCADWQGDLLNGGTGCN